MAKVKQANGKLRVSNFDIFVDGFKETLKSKGLKRNKLTAAEVDMEMDIYLRARFAARQMGKAVEETGKE